MEHELKLLPLIHQLILMLKLKKILLYDHITHLVDMEVFHHFIFMEI
jgi:hypothetical protein